VAGEWSETGPEFREDTGSVAPRQIGLAKNKVELKDHGLAQRGNGTAYNAEIWDSLKGRKSRGYTNKGNCGTRFTRAVNAQMTSLRVGGGGGGGGGGVWVGGGGGVSSGRISTKRKIGVGVRKGGRKLGRCNGLKKGKWYRRGLHD